MPKPYKLKKEDLWPGKVLTAEEKNELMEILNDPDIDETWVAILPDPMEQFGGYQEELLSQLSRQQTPMWG